LRSVPLHLFLTCQPFRHRAGPRHHHPTVIGIVRGRPVVDNPPVFSTNGFIHPVAPSQDTPVVLSVESIFDCERFIGLKKRYWVFCIDVARVKIESIQSAKVGDSSDTSCFRE
jgi:hypothetical protein